MISARTTLTTTTKVWSATNCSESGSCNCESLVPGAPANKLFCGESWTTDHPQKIATAMHTNANHGTLALGGRGVSLECVITICFLSTRAD